MPKAKAPKNLAVDGTNKLAAKAKPSDKHEKPELTIEEATVASPRPSRKRSGDYFDFEAEADNDAEASSKPAQAKAAPPKKKTKTITTDKDEKKTKKVIPAKDDGAAKPEKKEKKEKKIIAAKDDAAPKKEKAEPKSKPKKSKAEPAAGVVEDAATSVAPDLAMDEGPFERLNESAEGKAPVTAKGAKKPAKESKGPKEPKATKTKTPTAIDKAVEAADGVTKEAKGAVEKPKHPQQRDPLTSRML